MRDGKAIYGRSAAVDGYSTIRRVGGEVENSCNSVCSNDFESSVVKEFCLKFTSMKNTPSLQPEERGQ